MAKKQQIILTHGSSVPAASAMTLGEVLVQHATIAEDAALHTVLNDGKTPVSFPSKAYVDNKISSINIDNVNSTLESLQTQINNEVSARETADNEINQIIEENERVVSESLNDLNSRILKINGDLSNLEAKDIIVEGNIEAIQKTIDELDDIYVTDTELSNKVEELEGKITAAQTAATTKVVKGTDTGDNLSISSIVDDKGVLTYTIGLNDVASASDLQVETNRAISAETELREAIDAVNGAAKSYAIESKTEDLEENIEVEYTLYETVGISKTEKGKIQIKKDSSLISIDLVNEKPSETEGEESIKGQFLKYTYILANGENKTVYVDVSRFLVETEFKNGLQVNSTGEVSVKLDLENEKYLTFGANGELVSTGINDAISTAASNAVTSANTYTDNAKTAIESVIGGSYTSANTVHNAISANTNAISGIQNDLKNYVTDTELSNKVEELEGKITAAQTAATTKVVKGTDTGDNLSISSIVDDKGVLTYTIGLNDVASASGLTSVSDRVSTIENSYVNSVTVTNSSTNKITASINTNTLTLNFDNMIIDGGTY